MIIRSNNRAKHKQSTDYKSEREINKSRLNSFLTTRLQCASIPTVKSVFSEIPRTTGLYVSGSRAYADVSVGGKRGRARPNPAKC